MTTSIGIQMQENEHRALKAVAYTIGIVVYLGGVAYAEARAWSLFTRSIDPDLLPVAIVGIVALGLTAIGAPIAHHFGTAPGLQRLELDAFYAFDVFAMAANAVLDAAARSSGQVTSLLGFWGAYVLPALPLACLAGWMIFFMLDPGHKKRDTLLAARAATEEVLTARVVEQMKAVDLTEIVDGAARAAAAEIVGQAVGHAPERPVSLPTTPARPSRNGRKPEPVGESADPNG